MKKIIIASFFVAGILFLSGCSLNKHNNEKIDLPPKKSERINNLDKYYVKKQDGFVKYDITQTKPSPCHKIKINEQIVGKEITININIQPSDEICAQVITEEKLKGKIKINNPKSIKILVNKQKVYEKQLNKK